MKNDRTEPAGKRSFEEAIRQKLSALNRKPEDRVWQRLDSSLGKTGRKRGAGWRSTALVVLGLLAGLLVGILALKHLLPVAPPTIAKTGNSTPKPPAASGLRKPEKDAPVAARPQPEARFQSQPATEPEPATAKPLERGLTPNTPEATLPAKTASGRKKSAAADDGQENILAEIRKPITTARKESRGVLAARHIPAKQPQTKNKTAKGSVSRPAAADRNVSRQQPEPTPVTAANQPKNTVPGTERTQTVINAGKAASAAVNAPSVSDSGTINPGKPGTAAPAGVPLSSHHPLPGKPIADSSLIGTTGSLPSAGAEIAPASVSVADSARVNSQPDSAAATQTETKVTPADSAKTAPAPPAKMRRPISLTLLAGPAYFNQNLTISEKPRAGIGAATGSSPFTEAAAEFNRQTGRSPSFKAGLLVGWPVLPHLQVESGLGFSKFGMRSEAQYLASEVVFVGLNSVEHVSHQPLITMLLTNPGYENQFNASVEMTEPYQVNFSYQYLHLPLRLQTFYNQGRWRGFVAVGAEASRLVQSGITATHAKTQGRSLAPESQGIFREWLWAGTLSGGVGFAFTGQLHLQTSADYYRYFSPVINRTEIRGQAQEPPKFFGLSVGLTYTFLRR